ncbi:lysophospholipid acyltransferase family protein [Nocardioides bruguierae]|uniref:1-acyl-sn-glycerol-3-phosphate acyltransferase n=1 Tax=Nocardioides bruguierae TaxID=2945102 RepID=A0A9X2IHB9_9ACTN|nr:lysophospholipid acyltransferase family protein [Nocardioides bruguierae]MCL8026055.1 1-acyl-sn-glycerol-3-phosphate acyltransferase [Nocardioides bruguierae]MCM0622449.1 1-acyl-sn-glycerol-3-phosphate acyltransferase [Nocardioides bruguierae]
MTLLTGFGSKVGLGARVGRPLRPRERAAVHTDLPRTDTTPYPARHLLYPLRPVSRFLVRRRWDMGVHGEHRVPQGPVIFAANHVGASDGPLLAMFAPLPVHALTKSELFGGKLGTFLLHSGQVPLQRFGADTAAMRTCLRVLRDGGSVGIFPEGRRGDGEMRRCHTGVAYLAMVTGAPVVPVTFFGTREPGGRSGSLPPWGRRLDIVFGEPTSVEQTPWPRTKEHVHATTVLLHRYLREQLAAAKAETGRRLPGPLPAGDLEPDPLTATTVSELGEA